MPENKLEFKAEGDAAVEAVIEGTLKNEVLKVTAEGATPPVKKAKKLPAKKIKVEEAVPPFELPTAQIVIEGSNVEVQSEVEAVVPEAEVIQTEAAPPSKAPRQVITPTQNRSLVKQLRARDPDSKRTCASCLRRVPIIEIGSTGEICDACK